MTVAELNAIIGVRDETASNAIFREFRFAFFSNKCTPKVQHFHMRTAKRPISPLLRSVWAADHFHRVFWPCRTSLQPLNKPISKMKKVSEGVERKTRSERQTRAFRTSCRSRCRCCRIVTQGNFINRGRSVRHCFVFSEVPIRQKSIEVEVDLHSIRRNTNATRIVTQKRAMEIWWWTIPTR